MTPRTCWRTPRLYLKLPGVRVHVTFLFAAALALAVNAGRARAVGTVFVSALLHECAHLAFLLSYGARGLTLTLHPGGARIGGAALSALPYPKLLACVLAGPAVNLLLAGALVLCGRGAFLYAARVNLMLGAGNLLPLSFLDGGRALDCVLALAQKSPVPGAARGVVDMICVCAMLFACVIGTAKGADTLFLWLFTAYCGFAAVSRRPGAARRCRKRAD